jgi:hypothetical protein
MTDSAIDVGLQDGKSGALQTAKDLFSGAAGGIAQVLIGKTRSHYSFHLTHIFLIFTPPAPLDILEPT